MAVEMGRPALWHMSGTRKSSQPELSPRGAETRRSERPLKRRPAGTPVWRSSRSIRPWGEISRLPLPLPRRPPTRAARSKSSPGPQTWTRSCQPPGVPGAPGLSGADAWYAAALSRTPGSGGPDSGDADAPDAGAGEDAGTLRTGSARTAKSGRRTSPESGSNASSSWGIGASSVPAYPFGEKFQPSTEAAKARKSGSQDCGSSSGRKLRSSAHSRSSRCPSASRRSRIAPARTSAGAETTSPVGRTKPSHSRWAAMLGSGFATPAVPYSGTSSGMTRRPDCR